MHASRSLWSLFLWYIERAGTNMEKRQKYLEKTDKMSYPVLLSEL